MRTSIKQIILLFGLSFSMLACASEHKQTINPSHQSSRFIVQLTTPTAEQNQKQQKATLQQWEKDSGLTLKLVPPSNNQRWIIEANTQDNQQKKHLINIVSQHSNVSYIEEDSVMTIMPIKRSFTAPAQPTH